MTKYPLVLVIVQALFIAALAIPFWYLWTVWGIGGDYFGWFLPKPLEEPSLKDCVAVSLCISLLKIMVFFSLGKKNA